MSENYLDLIAKPTFECPTFSGGVSPLLSHPGWEPAIAYHETFKTFPQTTQRKFEDLKIDGFKWRCKR